VTIVKKTGIYVSLAATAALAYLLVAGPPSQAPEGSTKAPALAGPLSGGGKASLADYAGKVVLVDFWATWCDPCVAEIPELNALQEKLGPKGFSVLGVSMDEEGDKAVLRFKAKLPVVYPVILNGSERAPAGWSTPGFPTAYLIGKDGMVIRRWFGSKDMAEVEQDVLTAMEQ